MINNMDEEIHHVIHYFYRKNTPALSCHALFIATYGRQVYHELVLIIGTLRQGRQSVTQLGKGGRPKK